MSVFNAVQVNIRSVLRGSALALLILLSEGPLPFGLTTSFHAKANHVVLDRIDHSLDPANSAGFEIRVKQESLGLKHLRATLTNGELKSTTKSIVLSFDTVAILELVENLKEPSIEDRFQRYYIESRGFADPKIVVEILNEDRNIPPQRVSLAVNASMKPVIKIDPARPIEFIRVDIFGEVERWSCFNPATCALQETEQRRVFTSFEGRSDFAKRSEEILQCGANQSVSYQLSDSKMQKMSLQFNQDESSLGIPSAVQGRGQALTSCDDFSGFSGPLTWVNASGTGDVSSTFTYGRFLVRREGDRVATDFEILPHKLCEYERLTHDGRGYSVEHRVDVNQPCTGSITPGGLGGLRLLRETVMAQPQSITKSTETCNCALGSM